MLLHSQHRGAASVLCMLAALFLLSACGSIDTTDVAVSNVVFTLDAGDGDESNTSLGLKANDTASATCEFEYDATSSNGLIDVVDDANNCTSPNSCIVCTAWSLNNPKNCRIACAGTVPSSAGVAADSVVVRWKKTSVLEANETTATGVIRIDGRVYNWDDYRPDSGNVTVSYDLSGCDGSGGNLEAEETDPLGVFNESQQYFQQSFDIIDVGNSQCEIVTTVEAALPLTGADTPGATVDLTGESNQARIRARTKICKDPTKCKPPNWAP